MVTPAEIVETAGIADKLELLLETQFWSPEQRDAWRRERLDEVLAAAARSPRGRERFPAGAPFAALPPLTRQELAERPEDLRSGIAGPVLRNLTSGSSGRPVAVEQGAQWVGFESAVRLRHWEWWGLGRRALPEVLVAIRAAADDPPVRRVRETPAHFLVNPYAVTPRTAAEIHRALRDAAPIRLIDGVPSQVAALASAFEEAGVDGTELGLEVAVIGGEVIEPQQREVVERVFGCRTSALYGATECRVTACECPEGSLHVNDELVWLELLDAGDAPVAPGALGDVHVTPLHALEAPLVRYGLGDVATWIDEPCPCGRTLPRLDVALGRREEMVRLRDGSLLHPRLFRTIYERALGDALLAFHTVQTGAGAFRAELALRPGTPPPEAAQLEAEAGRYLGEPVQVEVHVVAFRPPEPGKRRSFTYAA